MTEPVALSFEEDDETVYPTLEAAVAALGALAPEGPEEPDEADGSPLEGEPDGGEA